MTIPFLNLFKKAKNRLGKQPEPPRVVVRPPALEKTAAEKLSKTVLPNSTRTVAPVDPFQAAAGATGSNRIRLRENDEPAENPPGERSITLTLGDLLPHLPQGSIKPADTLDPKRNITLKASEVEKGMATGQPTALLTSIYEEAPDIFRQSVPLTDLTQVSLPFEKVIEQFQALHVRSDQMQDEDVPQVETPFLQVTIEDTQKFGTSLAPLQTSAKPPVKVEPATAKAFAKAEPEPVAQQKQKPRIIPRPPISLTPKTETVPPPSAPPAAAPTRIPFNLPPNGAGVPASERVPASSGPPVPTPPPAPPKTAEPVRIPFKMAPPGSALKPKLTLVPGVEAAQTEAPTEEPVSAPTPPEAATPAGEKIKLRLNVCLRNLPAFQLSGDLPEISDDVLIELSYSIVEPQLATGRIAIAPKVFHSAIPEQFRSVFVVDTAETPVLLPLQEVLQHLPTTALKMRQDQEREEAIDHFETPFSLQAKQDQQRLGKPAAESPKPEQPAGFKLGESSPEPGKVETATPVETPEGAVEPTESAAPKKSRPAKRRGVSAVTPEPAEAARQPAPASPSPDLAQPADVSAAQPGVEVETEPATESATPTESKATDVEATSNAKEFVLRISCLPGVTGCSIAFADGLTMAGNLPPTLGADGLCAVAPSVLQKIQKHMVGSDLGSLNSMTLNCSKSLMSFFMQGNVCLTVLHAGEIVEPVTQQQLLEMTKELAQIFAQPETTHVDH